MKALSIRQPWANLIMEGMKEMECRNWPPPITMIGQEFLIHASGTVDEYALGLIVKGIGKEAAAVNCLRQPTGALLGRACLWGYKRYETEEEFFRDELLHLCARGEFEATRFAFCLKVLEVFKKPVPYPGRLGFFEVPEEALRACSLCGRSENNACEGGCAWVGEDLCSACLLKGASDG